MKEIYLSEGFGFDGGFPGLHRCLDEKLILLRLVQVRQNLGFQIGNLGYFLEPLVENLKQNIDKLLWIRIIGKSFIIKRLEEFNGEQRLLGCLEKILHLVRLVNHGLLRNVRGHKLIEVIITLLHHTQQSVLHDQSHHGQESLQLAKVVGDFGGFLHVEPTFAHTLEVQLNDFDQFVNPVAFQSVKDLGGGRVLNVLKLFEAHLLG